MLCTTDSGWTTISIRSGGRSNSQHASISSSPLLNIVAESIVIFPPIFHVGWFAASATVACSIASADAVRNGPPLAVRITRRTSLARPQCMAWNTAECSESTGRIATPLARASGISSDPAQTSDSLLASASVLPASTVASAAGSPAAPTTAATTVSTSGPADELDQPGRPGVDRRPQVPQGRRDRRGRRRVGHGHGGGAVAAGLLQQLVGLRVGRQGRDAVAVAEVLDDVQRVAPDRPGAAQNGDPLHRRPMITAWGGR